MPLIITQKWICNTCGNIKEVSHDIHPDSAIPKPSLPDGWNKVSGDIACDKHIIIYEVRDKEGE